MSKRIEGLDLLRFLAAFSVLVYHFFFIGPLEGNWPNSQYINIAHLGDFGVDVFFIISGFVIPLSSEGRTPWQFAKSRFLRIFPALLICSIITAVTSAIIPGVAAKDILYKWLASLTLFPQLFGQNYLSSVYWTLSIEIKFYILVFILMALGQWKKMNVVIPIWLVIALLNEFSLHNKFLHDVFLTQYAGHFVAGMLLYQLRYSAKSPFFPLGFLFSTILIWNSVGGIESWLGGTYNVRFSDIATFLISPFSILLVYCLSGIENLNFPGRTVSILGAMSYTLYLLHADFGFFQRVMWDRYGFVHFPELKSWFTNPIITAIAVVSSLILSALVSIYLEPILKNPLRRLLNFKLHRTLQSETIKQ